MSNSPMRTGSLYSIFGFPRTGTLPFVYAVIEKETGKWYIGCRTRKGCRPEDLGVKYFTSSRYFKKRFKASPESFSRKILYVGPDALAMENKMLVQMKASENPQSYNLHNGGGDFNGVKAALRTVELGVGVHARSKEKMSADGKAMVAKNRVAKTGMFSEDSRRRVLETQMAKSLGIHDPENRRRGAKKAGAAAVLLATGIHAPDFDKAAAVKIAHRHKYRCAECSYVAAAPHLANHQKGAGHTGRIDLGRK